LLRDISLLRGFRFAAPCDSPIEMNFLFIKVMRRTATAQYAAGYDTFGAVLFLETIATTFCRLRPEASHRHGLPLSLRLLPTTTSALDAVKSSLPTSLPLHTRPCRRPRELLPYAVESSNDKTRDRAWGMARRKLSLSVIVHLEWMQWRCSGFSIEVGCEDRTVHAT
jgi:hypothetical protein